MSDWNSWMKLFDAAMRGAAQPWIICLALVLTTFLLEDLAIAVGAVLAVQGALSWELAVLAVGGGIALGDVGLYGLGVAANRVPYLRKRLIEGRGNWVGVQLRNRFVGAIFLARVIPGLRLITYTACGFYRLAFWPFCGWVVLAVTAWTVGLMWLSSTIGAALSRALGIPPALAVALPIVLFALVMMFLPRSGNRAASHPQEGVSQ